MVSGSICRFYAFGGGAGEGGGGEDNKEGEGEEGAGAAFEEEEGGPLSEKEGREWNSAELPKRVTEKVRAILFFFNSSLGGGGVGKFFFSFAASLTAK